jgi:hypothetical protein
VADRAAVTLAVAVSLPHADLLSEHRFAVRLEWMVAVLLARLALTVQLVVAVFGLRRRLHAVLLRPAVPPNPIAGSAE